MKKLKSQLRMWLAEKLLGWCYTITPWNEEGHVLRRHIAAYYYDKLKEELN